MRYGLGIRLLIAFVVGGVAVLYKIRVDPKVNRSEVSSVINVPRQFLFDVVTDPSNVPAYFSWVTRIRSPDRRGASTGKRYRGILNMPFFGQHQFHYKVTDCHEGTWIVLRPEKRDQSYFNTEVLLMLNSISATQTQFYMKISYQRSSALFQLTAGPILKWLTDQQLRRTALNVRVLAMSKWKRLSGSPADFENYAIKVTRNGTKKRSESDDDIESTSSSSNNNNNKNFKRAPSSRGYIPKFGGKLEL